MNNYLLRVRKFYNNLEKESEIFRSKNKYYHKLIFKVFKQIVPQDKNILELGCGSGDLLNFLRPNVGVGVDISEKFLKIAKKEHKKMQFINEYAENYTSKMSFDFIILDDLIGILYDIHKTLLNIEQIAGSDTRIVISYHNFIWEPLLLLLSKLKLKRAQPKQSWLNNADMENFIDFANLEIIRSFNYVLLPINIPIISEIINKYIARMPLINKLCLYRFLILRKKNKERIDYTVSVIIPARNESGNIEQAVNRIPNMGKKTELIFIEGNSSDNTRERILHAIKNNTSKRIILIDQDGGIGKADAVRRGIRVANGEILIIFDADLTVLPEDLPKFYEALVSNKAEFLQGSRLVYPMEKEAMRFLNIIGNKFFSIIFSYLLDQTIKDTLCGTKIFFKKDYSNIIKNQKFFGNFDPFGDFDLIFGANKLNLKIKEIPVRYLARSYGKTNIKRFYHGWLLLNMAIIAAKKIKFF